MSDTVKSRIIKQGLFEWRKAKWFQPENLKRQSKAEADKLKTSLLKNGFASPLYLWENKSTTYILDGHHRERILKELEAAGHSIPDKLPAIWVDCKNEKEAKKFLAIYSSEYAKVRPEAFFEFMQEFDLAEILSEISIFGIDFLNGILKTRKNILTIQKHGKSHKIL